MQAYPNPFQNKTAIRYSNTEVGDTRIELLDAMGKIVEQTKLTAKAGEIFVGQGLSAGVYFVRIQSDFGHSETLKLIKQQ